MLVLIFPVGKYTCIYWALGGPLSLLQGNHAQELFIKQPGTMYKISEDMLQYCHNIDHIKESDDNLRYLVSAVVAILPKHIPQSLEMAG